MENKDIQKIIKYRPPLLLSLLVIVGFFVLFLYISKNRVSYAIVEENKELSSNIKLQTIASDIISDTGIKVDRINSDDRQVFSSSINNNYGEEYIQDKKIDDLGLLYVLYNNYPNKDLTDKKGNSLDTDLQTWITQVSIWLYLNNIDNDQVNKIINSRKVFSNNKSLNVNKKIYDKYIKNIVSSAKKVSIVDKKVTALLENDNVYMTKDNKYYQSSLVTVSASDSDNFKGYTVDLSNTPKGTIIVDEDGRKLNNGKILKATDKFYVRVPKNKVIRDKSEIVIGISGIYNDIEGYYYKSEGYDNIIAFRNFDKNIDEKLYIRF